MNSRHPVKMLLLGDHAVGLRLQFARELNDHGIDVTIAAPIGTEVTTGEGDPAIVHYPLDARHPLRTARAIRALRRSTGADIVHAFSTAPATMAAIAAWLDRDGCYLRTVNGLGRSFTIEGAKGRLMRWSYTAAMIALGAKVRLHIFQNRDDDRWFASTAVLRGRDHRVILGSGVDTESFSRDAVNADRVAAANEFLGKGGRPTAVLVGRHMRSKGVDDLYEAGRLIGASLPDDTLLAVVGPADSSADATAATNATFGKCEFALRSSWKDMPALFAAADVAVLPTVYREGIPRVLLEAAALGLPIVAYDVPGCREIVQSGRNGVLVRPHDIDGLATALASLLGDESARQAMGQASRELACGAFEVRTIAAQYADAYFDTLGVRRAVAYAA